jgi:hypothetical protein
MCVILGKKTPLNNGVNTLRTHINYKYETFKVKLIT